MTINQLVKLPAEEAAPLLLGCTLSRKVPEGLISLRIVETEAYHQSDPASHSHRGITARTAPMFEAGGRIYIYFTYGMHYCMNIVVGKKGVGEAVLLRAGEPLKGIEIMKKNRKIDSIRNLANGPGKLAQALGISDTKLSGEMLDKSSIFLSASSERTDAQSITTSSRIGITKAVDVPWRFYIKNNIFVSKTNSQ